MATIGIEVYSEYWENEFQNYVTSFYVDERLLTWDRLCCSPERIATSAHDIAIREKIPSPKYEVRLLKKPLPKRFGKTRFSLRFFRPPQEFQDKLEYLLNSKLEFQRSKKFLAQVPQVAKIIVQP